MMPIGPLMIEHRLIERMIAAVKREVQRIEVGKPVDPVFIDTAVDFMRTYADRTHHGKEEDILFRDLAKKDVSLQDQEQMRELVEEHKFGRKTVGELVEAKQQYLQGHPEALPTILARLHTLTGFYPEHIRKEDRVFFPAAMRYFSHPEQDAMLQECWEFDRRMIHEKYRSVVERFEQAETAAR